MLESLSASAGIHHKLGQDGLYQGAVYQVERNNLLVRGLLTANLTYLLIGHHLGDLVFG